MSPSFPTALAAIVLAHSSSAEPLKISPPPAAPKGDATDTYHGTQIADPYRAMENLKDPKVLEWMKAQSAYATALLDQIPGRKTLLKRIQELDKGAPFTVSHLGRLQDGTIFYQKLDAGAETRVICSRKSATGPETLVLDPKVYESAGGSHASLEFFMPSPDGRFGIAGISKGGSEVTTIYVRDLAAGKDLPGSIDRIETAYNVPQWLPDSTGFFYSRRQQLPEGTPASETYKNTIAYLHKLGSPVEEDLPVFGFNLSPKIAFAPLDFPSVRVFPTSEYVIGQIHHGDSQELTLYSTRREAMQSKSIPWKKVCGVPDAVVAFEIHGDFAYLVTSKGAPRYKVVRVPLADPVFARAEVVLPESDLVLTSVHAAQDALFVNATRNGSGVIVQVDPDGSEPPRRLEPPLNLTGEVAEASPFFPEIFVSTESWTKGGALYTYDAGKRTYAESALQPKGAFDEVPGYSSKEVEVKSHDGAMVPLSIIYKDGLKFDGTHPLMLNGYGAYGSIRRAGFSPMNLAWLERGGIVAVAHVRGGGEKGKEWHTGGQKSTKPNTWKDLIACAEYLIAEKFTSTPKLAIQGGSAGGILIGRAITERPDLFRAAIIMVGVTDMLRFETTENGPPNVQEFGSVATKEGFQDLLAMSAWHHVKDGVNYPAVLLMHGLNDRRVDAWMSGKMTARLQAATTSGNPVLLLLDTESGHGIGSKRSQIHDQLASRWSFALWQMGEEGFQPAKAE